MNSTNCYGSSVRSIEMPETGYFVVTCYNDTRWLMTHPEICLCSITLTGLHYSEVDKLHGEGLHEEGWEYVRTLHHTNPPVYLVHFLPDKNCRVHLMILFNRIEYIEPIRPLPVIPHYPSLFLHDLKEMPIDFQKKAIGSV